MRQRTTLFFLRVQDKNRSLTDYVVERWNAIPVMEMVTKGLVVGGSFCVWYHTRPIASSTELQPEK